MFSMYLMPLCKAFKKKIYIYIYGVPLSKLFDSLCLFGTFIWNPWDVVSAEQNLRNPNVLNEDIPLLCKWMPRRIWVTTMGPTTHLLAKVFIEHMKTALQCLNHVLSGWPIILEVTWCGISNTWVVGKRGWRGPQLASLRRGLCVTMCKAHPQAFYNSVATQNMP